MARTASTHTDTARLRTLPANPQSPAARSTSGRRNIAVAAFMADIGEDNRLFYSDQSADPRLRRAMYIASRKNFDRLVAEGKAIL